MAATDSSKPSRRSGAAADGAPPRQAASADARPEPQRELSIAFRHVSRALNRVRGRDTHLAGSELSHAQFELLIELHEHGPMSAGELAGAARLSPGTVTQMLDALAESGHVERARSQDDRRVVVSRLTPRGEDRIEAKRRAWQGRWDEALEGFGERDLRAAARVLEALAEMFEREGPARAGAGVEDPPAKSPEDGRKPA